MAAEFDEVTALLERVRRGAAGAMNDLIKVLYDDFRRRAHWRLLHERPGRLTATTELTHEALMKLQRNDEIAGAADRNQVFAAFDRAMREILIDHARRRRAERNGGGWQKVPLDDLVEGARRRIQDDVPNRLEVVDMLEALEALARDHPRQAEVLKLRFYSGHTMPEIARILGVALATVERDHSNGRAWLRAALSRGPDS